jgi:hypothetical protein
VRNSESFHLAGGGKNNQAGAMKLVTLSPSGKIIDLDSVAFVGLTQSNAGNGIKIIVGGAEETMFGEEAREFLRHFHDLKSADVERLTKWVPKKA